MASDGLRRGSSESASLPTEVKEVLAMFGWMALFYCPLDVLRVMVTAS
jgi:hypothetical protein